MHLFINPRSSLATVLANSGVYGKPPGFSQRLFENRRCQTDIKISMKEIRGCYKRLEGPPIRNSEFDCWKMVKL